MKLKKSVKRFLIVLLIVLILATVILWFVFGRGEKKQEPQTATVVETLDDYGYSLRSDATSLQKSLFEELKQVLNAEPINEEEYAKIVARSFIADFYTLDNKVTNNDVGGAQYFYSAVRDNFILSAQDSIYKYVESDLYGDREQELPIVTAVEVTSITSTTYTLGEVTDDKAYQVEATITYQKDLGYDSSRKLIIMHDENDHLSIVEIS